MAYISELARWTKGEHSFTALAEAGNLQVQPHSKVGISTSRTRSWIERGKADATHTVRCAQLTRDPALLIKLSKDRRVVVRKTVLQNPLTPFDVVAAARAKDKSPEVFSVADSVLKRRCQAMSADEVVALVNESATEQTLQHVCAHRKLEDRHVQALWDTEITVKNKWHNERIIKLAMLIAARDDLHRFTDETLIGLCERGQWNYATRALVRRRGAVTVALDAMESSGKVDQHALAHIAGMPELSADLAARIYSIADEGRMDVVQAQLASNPAVDWRMFVQERLRRSNVAALGRALAELFVDEPAVWKLAEQLCNNNTTVGEIIDVLNATYPAAREQLGS
jgi:hypothetical protein